MKLIHTYSFEHGVFRTLLYFVDIDIKRPFSSTQPPDGSFHETSPPPPPPDLSLFVHVAMAPFMTPRDRWRAATDRMRLTHAAEEEEDIPLGLESDSSGVGGGGDVDVDVDGDAPPGAMPTGEKRRF